MLDESAQMFREQLPLRHNYAVSRTATGAEAGFAEVLAELVGKERVSVDGHFFEELGANSLMMAHFYARVRKRTDVPSVSMKDIYRYPPIRELAAAVADVTPSPGAPSVPVTVTAPSVPAIVEEQKPTSTSFSHVLCGAAQLLVFLAYSYVVFSFLVTGIGWASAGSDVVDIYLRSAVMGAAGFVGACLFPVVAKWVLIGRWRQGDFPVWGQTYLRFWIVKVLLHVNPMVLFAGNPLFVFYLRALGARIGKGVTILSPSVPVCTDLLTIGDGSVIRKESLFPCYRFPPGARWGGNPAVEIRGPQYSLNGSDRVGTGGEQRVTSW